MGVDATELYRGVVASIKRDSDKGELITAAEVEKNILPAVKNLPVEAREATVRALVADVGAQFASEDREKIGQLLGIKIANVAETKTSTPATVALAPVDAKKKAVLEAIDKCLCSPEAGSALLSPERVRNQGYQEVVDRIDNHPVAKEIEGEVKRLLGEMEADQRQDQALHSAVITKDNNMSKLFPWGPQVYDTVQEIGKKMGFFRNEKGQGAEEIKVAIQSSSGPNAFVYTSDDKHPRVTFYTPIVEICWDDEKGDWLSMSVDKDGKPVKEGTPGAQELPIGKLLFESVAAHELGHIKDQAIYYSTMFQLLYNFAHFEVKAREGKELTPQTEKMIEQAKKFIDDGDWKFRHNQGLPLAEAERLMPRFEQMMAKKGITPEDAAQALSDFTNFEALRKNPDFAANKYLAKGQENFGRALGYYDQYYALSRAAEHTADRYNWLEQGTNKWGAIMDLLLTTRTNFDDFATTAKKRQQFKLILDQGVEDYAQTMLKEYADDDKGVVSQDKIYDMLTCVSHPPGAARIQLGVDYVNDPQSYFQQLEKFKGISDPTEKLVGLLQCYQDVVNRTYRRFDAKAQEKLDGTSAELSNAHFRPQIKQWERYAQPLVDALNTAVSDTDLTAKTSTTWDMLMQAGNFLNSPEGGAEAWKGTPMVMLLGAMQKRLKVLKTNDTLDADSKKVVTDRLKQVDTAYKMAAKRQIEMNKANAKTETEAETLKKILEAVKKPAGTASLNERRPSVSK